MFLKRYDHEQVRIDLREGLVVSLFDSVNEAYGPGSCSVEDIMVCLHGVFPWYNNKGNFLRYNHNVK